MARLTVKRQAFVYLAFPSLPYPPCPHAARNVAVDSDGGVASDADNDDDDDDISGDDFVGASPSSAGLFCCPHAAEKAAVDDEDADEGCW